MPAGTRLMDYDIEGLLGVGGFGLVYRARDAVLQRTVAIKEYLPSTLALRGDRGEVILRSPTHEEPFALGLRSFINEARLLARFDHPSLVKVFRFWEAQGTAYMVMPCYEGPTLYDARRALEGPPDEAWLRALMDPLLGALDCLHREQVYHRDVAPDNILVVHDPDAPLGMRPVLLDFGAARRVITENSQALTAILKPSFAPIEQYAETSQLRQGPWTDLYGLAAVLHYCITGRTPVPATARAVHDDLPVLRQMAGALAQDFGRHYSPALLGTIDRALGVRPDARPASVTEWRDALLAEPAAEVSALGPVDGDSPDAGTARHAWTERTVMVAPGQGRKRPGADTDFPTTHAMAASGLFAGPSPTPARVSRGAVWGIGVLALAGIVALSSWSLQRHRATSAVVTDQDGSVVTAAQAQAPGGTGAALRPVRPVLMEVGDGAPDGGHATTGPPARDRGGAMSRQPEAGSSRSARAGDAASRPVRERLPLNPRQACGDRVFIAMAICMKQHCGKPEYGGHAECTRMRQQEEAQRNRYDFH